MSEALAKLITTYWRVPSSDKHRSGDEGRVPPPEAVARTLDRLTANQRRVMDEAVFAELADHLEKTLQETDRWGKPKQKGEKSGLVRMVMARDPVARGVALTNWAIVIGLYDHKDRTFIYTHRSFGALWWLREAYKFIDKRKHVLTLDQVRAVIDSNRGERFGYSTIDTALGALATNREQWRFTDEDRKSFEEVAEALGKFPNTGKIRTHIAMLKELAGDGTDTGLPVGEPWAAGIGPFLEEMGEAKLRWTQFLSFAGTCSMDKPSRGWLKQATEIVATLDPTAFETALTAWLRGLIEVGRAPAPQPPATYNDETYKTYRAAQAAYTTNTALVVGLVWMTQTQWHPRFGPSLADLVEAVAKRPREERELNAPIGAAAIKALGTRDDDKAAALLSRLEMRIRWPKLKKVVTKHLGELIKRRGLDRSELEETVVPDFGLKDGVATLAFGDLEAVTTLDQSDKPSLTWRIDGKVTRRPPNLLKEEHPAAAERAKELVGDIEKMRAAQRTRLDLLLRRPRMWEYAAWRERYLDHGLVGSLARRLIWIVGETPAVWREGTLVDQEGNAIEPAKDVVVRLWHPAARPMEEVATWRSALEGWGITQPFKQAHREVYLLTDAERRTNVYSNRFAAHIVRAMTLLSISQVRQWKSGLYGGASSPSFELADFGLRAEWWVEAAGDEHTPMGSPVYLATDQVRFLCTSQESAAGYGHSGELGEPLPLDRVPLLAFTEIMRDIDLFVALASVGNNPEWNDGGPGGHFRDYWHGYSFGDLTATAQTRKQVLERIVPRLKIRERAAVDSKFLVVRGDLRTYKIHLGSGNILMEPNDQYLCIVPKPSAVDAATSGGGGKVFLPFEGDRVLSIILSKAFLLAEDRKITDPTITRQIEG